MQTGGEHRMRAIFGCLKISQAKALGTYTRYNLLKLRGLKVLRID